MVELSNPAEALTAEALTAEALTAEALTAEALEEVLTDADRTESYNARI
jgi:hypothetical protein